MSEKPQINSENPRIKKRLKEQQKYRDDLANTLKELRKGGSLGRKIAQKKLQDQQNTEEYYKAQQGKTEVDILIEKAGRETVLKNIDYLKDEGKDQEALKKVYSIITAPDKLTIRNAGLVPPHNKYEDNNNNRGYIHNEYLFKVIGKPEQEYKIIATNNDLDENDNIYFELIEL